MPHHKAAGHAAASAPARRLGQRVSGRDGTPEVPVHIFLSHNGRDELDTSLCHSQRVAPW